MPQQGGIRSYQVVNDGTDDQFVYMNKLFKFLFIQIYLY
jgi:hypothetical protein